MIENETECFEALGLESPAEEERTEPADAPAAEEGQESVPAPKERRPAQQADMEFRRRVDEELREIRRYDPRIETPRDLLRLDRRDAFFDAVKNHRHTLAEAYRYVYADRIAEAAARKAAEQAAQRVRYAERGKAHMRATSPVGPGGAAVPAEIRENIRAIYPKATDREIDRFYQKYVRETN